MFEAVKSCHISGLIYEEAAPVIFWDLKDSMNKTTKSGKDWSFLKDLATGHLGMLMVMNVMIFQILNCMCSALHDDKHDQLLVRCLSEP